MGTLQSIDTRQFLFDFLTFFYKINPFPPYTYLKLNSLACQKIKTNMQNILLRNIRCLQYNEFNW